jgi:hypothetical protein
MPLPRSGAGNTRLYLDGVQWLAGNPAVPTSKRFPCIYLVQGLSLLANVPVGCELLERETMRTDRHESLPWFRPSRAPALPPP